MSPIRLVMIGGFLGSGKTTLLGRLARYYLENGRRVGIITNDQAENLVDTRSFREQGLPAAEIPGGCFCCRFNALADAAAKLAQAERPDLLLAEPVGSCSIVSPPIRSSSTPSGCARYLPAIAGAGSRPR
jgi:G3E family GTPase